MVTLGTFTPEGFVSTSGSWTQLRQGLKHAYRTAETRMIRTYGRRAGRGAYHATSAYISGYSSRLIIVHNLCLIAGNGSGEPTSVGGQ
jgi:hypothetical protein